jgi:hypothetical protein
MNVLRTIQRDECKTWVELLFRRSRPRGRYVPGYPPTFPLPVKPRHSLANSWLYLVFDDNVYGFGRIASVRPHRGAYVGTRRQPARPGRLIVMSDRLQKIRRPIPCRGFTGIRYTPTALHLVSTKQARAALTRAGIKVP